MTPSTRLRRRQDGVRQTLTIQRLYTHAKTTSQADGPSGWRWNIHSPIVDARKDRKVKQSEERDRRITMDEHAAIQAVFARMAVERELSIKSGRKLLKIKPTATGASINIWSRDRLMRIEAAYLAALETAMREEKLFLMTWRWIDTSTERWNIVIPKQHQGPSNKNTPVAIAVSPRLKAILKELRGDLPRIGKALDEPVFGELDADYAYRLLKKTCAALSIDDFTWHDLRHEACSRMAADGWTIAQIQRVSGHKTLSQLDRSESVPHIPAIAEVTELKDFDIYSWIGYMAPKGTPSDVLDRINSAARSYLDTPEAKEKFKAMGLGINPQSNAEFQKVVEREVALYKSLLGKLGLGRQ